MSINVSDLSKKMLVACKGVLKDNWPDIKEYAESETKKLAQALVLIEKLHLAGKITKKQAKLHLDIQKNSMRIVLLAIEGMGVLMVEKAINAALAVVKDTVNSALNFKLL